MRRARLALLLLILLFFVALKARFNPTLGGYLIDADYYYQIARHVADGDGLVSSVSLYHAGIRQLPSKTTTYPLWPLVLGYTGRVIGMERAAFLLPEVLYIANLILLYALANRIAKGRTLYRAFDAGHACVLVFGSSGIFFRITSLPYTEGLAFLLAFAALLLLSDDNEVTAARAAFAGIFAGLSYLTRTPMIGLLGGIALAFAVRGARDRKQWLHGAAFAAAAALVVIPWIQFLLGFVSRFDPMILLDFTAYQETPELDRPRFLVETPTLGAFVLDRLSGFAVAFNPMSWHSYVASFGAAALLVPFVAVHALLRRPWPAVREMVRDRVLVVVSLVAGGAALLAWVHLAHGRTIFEWLFAHRQGLPLIFLLIVAIVYWMESGESWARALVVVVVLASAASEIADIKVAIDDGWKETPAASEVALSSWLNGESPRPIVVTTKAQKLGVLSDAGFHWLLCEDRPEQVRRIFRLLGVDYLVVYSGEDRCPFFQGMASELRLVRTFDGSVQDTIRVYAPK